VTAAGVVRLRACAKVNLALEILGRRTDGYHEVRTVLQTIALWDDVDISTVPARGVTVDAPRGWDVPHDEANLAVRAIRRYSQQTGVDVSLRLHKRVPPAAGLGGGSSDAAAALRGSDLLNSAPFGGSWLQRLGAELGSDVPFFVRGGTQLAEGRGELLSPLPDAQPAWLVVVVPPLTIDRKTATLYGLLDGSTFTNGNHTRSLTHAVAAGRALEPTLLYNGFDAVADRAFPELPRYREALVACCGHALLCGAGPSLYAIVADDVRAQAAVAALREAGVPAFATRTAGHREAEFFER
jgi:4-diphosphocytidyl-2-C-methyl-D-erythritol kinase